MISCANCGVWGGLCGEEGVEWSVCACVCVCMCVCVRMCAKEDERRMRESEGPRGSEQQQHGPNRGSAGMMGAREARPREGRREGGGMR
jgi:hypothetical protein